MGGLMITELVITAALVALVMLVGATVVRRRLISRGAPMVVCAHLPAGGRSWRYGLARFDADALVVHPLTGFSLRPALTLSRAGMEVLEARAAEPSERPGLVDDPVVVTLADGGALRRLVLPRDAFTAVRSWHEASPPGRPPRAA